MKKRLGCLHAHYSNIKYIEHAFSPFDLELIHFVDPGLMCRLGEDSHFHETDAKARVKAEIEWIAQSNVDAILITCTNYIALLQEDQLSLSVPIIKIDEPYFECISNIHQPQTILFTNPATVEGTMNRLHQYSSKHGGMLVNVEAEVIPETFELIMQGFNKEYNKKVAEVLMHKLKEDKKVLSVAQLSMADAAKQVELETSKSIINPLETLVAFVLKELSLKR